MRRFLIGPVVLLLGLPFASNARSQALFSADGALPSVSGVSIPAPPIPVPPCLPIAGCPAPALPPFPAGIFPPSMGGEAIDLVPGILYTTDGVLLDTQTFPGCAPLFPPIPFPVYGFGPCGVPIGPVVAMSFNSLAGTLWLLDPMFAHEVTAPPAPPAILNQFPAGIVLGAPGMAIAWSPFPAPVGSLWLSGPLGPALNVPIPPPFCLVPPVIGVLPIPPCLAPPVVGLTVDRTGAPGVVWASDGGVVADLTTGICPCPVLPPALIPTTDVEFVAQPYLYGAPGCGCASAAGPGPTLGFAGGFPVSPNPGFAITLSGSGPAVGLPAILILGLAPGILPLAGPPFAAGCTLNLAPGAILLFLAGGTGPGGAPPCPGTAAWPLPIPPGVAGGIAFFQGAVIDPAGFEVTDGFAMSISLP